MPGETTRLLQLVAQGDSLAESDLIPRVYRDLRALATGYLRRERPGHTFQPTDLIHEVYMRLLGTKQIPFQDRSHFFRVAASAMRRILVEHARAQQAQKRGGKPLHVPMEFVADALAFEANRVLDLDAALARLEQMDERQSKIVELRFFGGMAEDEIATALDISTRTVKREWAMARAWLFDEIGGN